MLLTILGLFLNWYMLAYVGVLLALAAAIYFIPFFGGPPGLLAFVLKPSTWIAVAAGAILVTFLSNGDEINKLQQENANQAIVIDASKDSQTVVSGVLKKHRERAVDDVHLQDVINKAPPGQATDALLDEIERERCAVTPQPTNCATPPPAPTSALTPPPTPTTGDHPATVLP